MDTEYRKTLWVKTAMIMLGVAIVPLFTLGIIVYYYLDAAYETIIMNTLQTSALDARNAVQLFLDERVTQLVTIAETHSLDQLKDHANLDNVLNRLKSSSRFFSAIEILDSQGNRIEYAGPVEDTLERLNNANGDWCRAVLSSGVYISNVFADHRNSEHFFVAVAHPNGARWILRAMVEAQSLDAIVAKAQGGEKDYAFIVNKSNLLQTSTRSGNMRLRHPSGHDFSSVTSTKVMKIHYGEEDSFVAVTHFQNLDWVLVVKADYMEQMGPLLNARYTQGLIMACGVLLILGGTILTIRFVLRESERLSPRRIGEIDAEAKPGKMIALGRMAAGIAHEINNPLAIVGGMAGWMKDLLDEQDIRATKNFETYRECIAKIEGEVKRCKTVTHRLLSFGRGITKKPAAVDVNRLLAEVVSLLESEAYFRDITIRVYYGKGIPQITADPTKLQQVLFDVLDESIDTVGKAGSIIVDTSYTLDSDEICIVISRMSSGSFPKSHDDAIEGSVALEVLPTKVTKVDSSNQGVVTKLGGSITVTESAEGHTACTISLPASPSENPALG